MTDYLHPRHCPNCGVYTDLLLCGECWRIALIAGLGTAAIESVVRWLT